MSLQMKPIDCICDYLSDLPWHWAVVHDLVSQSKKIIDGVFADVECWCSVRTCSLWTGLLLWTECSSFNKSFKKVFPFFGWSWISIINLYLHDVNCSSLTEFGQDSKWCQHCGILMSFHLNWSHGVFLKVKDASLVGRVLLSLLLQRP